MLTEAEERIARLEAAIQTSAQKSKIAYLPGVVEACYRQAAVSPDKQIFVYREIVLRQVVNEKQAEEIAQACAGDAPSMSLRHRTC